MIAVALAFLRVAWPYLLAALIAWMLWGIANKWHNKAWEVEHAARIEAEAQVAQWKLAKQRADEEAERVRGKWAEESVRAQADAIESERKIHERFEPVARAARNLPPADARVRFPDSATRVLNDAIAAGNAEIAAAAAGVDGKAEAAAADPVDPSGDRAARYVADVTAWGAEVSELYTSCAVKLTKWQSFYASLQWAQLGTAEQLH